jgi:hypothetical protein
VTLNRGAGFSLIQEPAKRAYNVIHPAIIIDIHPEERSISPPE